MAYPENSIEAADRVKQFLKKYGNTLSTVLLVIIIAIVGLQYWHKHEAKVNQQASVAYENLLGTVTAKKTIQLQALADQLINDYSGTPYAKLAALIIAKEAVNDKKYSVAITKLQWVVEHAKSASIKAVAQLRLARVMISNKQSAEALAVLQSVKPQEFLAEADTVKGDAYFALNKEPQAKQAYNSALNLADKASPLYSYIQMKLYSI